MQRARKSGRLAKFLSRQGDQTIAPAIAAAIAKLTEAVEIYGSVNHTIYEINKCQREQELCSIIEELKGMCIDMQEKLDEIDESLEFETVDDEDEIEE